MSLDQIGPLARNVEDAALLLSVIQGKDEKDSISQEIKSVNSKSARLDINKLKVGVLDIKISDDRIQNLINDKIEKVVKKYGWKLEKIKLNYIDLAVQTYYPLVYVEFFSGTRKFDGRRYGKRIENSAGVEVLRRILGGSEITKAEFKGRYYYLALKAKKLIEEEFSKAFKKFDAIVMPVYPILPWKIGDVKKMSVQDIYSADALTIPANLAGNCAVSIPAGKVDNVPVGMQIMCDKFQDAKMLQIAGMIEKV